MKRKDIKRAKRLMRQYINHYWGERCEAFELDCPCCRAWSAYDLICGKTSAIALRLREDGFRHRSKRNGTGEALDDN